MPLDIFLTFLGACLLLFLKPGPAMSVIVANSVEYRARGGLVTVAGNVLGFALLIAVVAFGLAWIAEVLRLWFDWLRLGGAFYLIWLGATRLRHAGRVFAYGENPTGELFRDGFIVAVANPEVILFLAAFLPPFVDPARPVAPQLAILGATFIAVSALAGTLLAVLAGQTRRFLSGDRLKWIDYASGSLIIIAGLWLAWPKGGT
ncbi:MAG: LysE family translocator [Rhizobiales bacterium]|nr:LysE family translocator [Hyphomicrobiales bacterium]MBI3672486.1 LysE family translocator [Hyphomicrobiales bacterium]